jgi:phosphatidylinositol alpha-1,6-mannosyltransferase
MRGATFTYAIATHSLKHLFVTQDYAPDLGGMARRHVELCRRFGDFVNTMEVSTVASPNAARFDAAERYQIHRQPFPFSQAKLFANQLRWARWLRAKAPGNFDVLHCGNIRPVGYAVAIAHYTRRIPYLVYVNGADLLREMEATNRSMRRRIGGKRILAGASGIVATSAWVGTLAEDAMREFGVKSAPPVGVFDLGTDPVFFNPSRDTRELRTRWRIGNAPLILTVARLVPHKGQDVVIKAVASLRGEFPALRYAIVGVGPDEARLRDLTGSLGMTDRIIFAGALSDDEVAEAYATSTVYAGLSRVEEGIHAEGFGISFLEAAASGVPSVAGDSGGVRSAVRDGITGIVVPPTDVGAVANALRTFLSDEAKRTGMGQAGRKLVETYYNWDRVARDTRDFTLDVTSLR